MTFVRRLSYLLVILPLFTAGCGRQPLLDDGGAGGVGDTRSTRGDNPRGIDPDRDGDDDSDRGGGDDDGDRGGGDDGDRGGGDQGDDGDDSGEDKPRPPGPPRAPQPVSEQCLDKCETLANDFFEQCLMQNTSKKSCLDQRQKYHKECVVSNCGGMSDPGVPDEPSPPPMISCEDQCVVGSASEFIGCVQSGRPLEFCAVIAQDNVDGCQSDCNGEDSLSCEETCEQDAAEAYNLCAASGRPTRRCEQFHQDQFRSCVQRCR